MALLLLRVVLLVIALGFAVPTLSGRTQGPVPNVNDGNALLRECAAALSAVDDVPTADRDPVERGSDMGQCLGLVSGVWHTHMMMVDEFESHSAFCPSGSISAGEMARLVTRYLETHPTQLEEWDTVLVMRAFMQTFPCS